MFTGPMFVVGDHPAQPTSRRTILPRRRTQDRGGVVVSFRRVGPLLAAVLIGSVVVVVGPAKPAAAGSYVPISGSGSTLAYNAIHKWQAQVAQFAMIVNYAPVGSTTGRSNFKQGTVDFAATEIPYGVVDGVSNDPPPARGFTYVPASATATVFAYNLKVASGKVTNLRLSGDAIAKIFTGVITRWNDPAIAVDNPGISLPAIAIVPVVRSDGSGVTEAFTQWMAATEGQYWTAYCAKVGRSPCTPTSAYPVLPGSGMVAVSGDVGPVGYASQGGAVGAITYAEYPYVLQSGLPSARVLNSAGYYTLPTAGNIGLSLLAARVNADVNNLVTYQTADLSGVYTNPDPRTYELSWYSYLIVPTDSSFGFDANHGFTLGDFGRYGLCAGQNGLNSLGYAALPINLVEAGFAQLQHIPGAQMPATTADFISSCANATFATNGTDLLASGVPMPQPCDQQGPIQCATTTQADVQGETINVNVPLSEGIFTMTVSGAPVVLSPAQVVGSGTAFESTGQLGQVTISDSRNQTQPGWSVNCQISDFSGGGNTFSGSRLGWTPTVVTQDAAADVVAGPVVRPGTDPGLKGGPVLASAAPANGLGTSVLSAALDLLIPADTAAGTYTATLTVTAIEQG
jgi:ABC-type phosphate transport system substrate-binding protein